MLARIFCLWYAALSFAAAKADVVHQSRNFPLGVGPENIVLRSSGSALIAVGTLPQLYQVAPSAGAVPELVYEFPNALGVSSIAPGTETDVYFAITGNYSYETRSPAPASYNIYRVSFDQKDTAVVRNLAALDAIAQPNGMVHVPGTPYVLIADCYRGLVFRFNTVTFDLTTYFDHPLLKPQPADGFTFGVNGLKLSRGYLYFSNTNQELVARIPATGLEPCLVGAPEIIATQAPVDDFVVDHRTGDLFMAFNVVNALGYLAHDASTKVPKVILGGGNSTKVLGPSSVAWAKGREGKELLVPSSGGFLQYVEQNFTVAAKLETVRIDGSFRSSSAEAD